MGKQFLKKGQVVLVSGGYVTNGDTQQPVFNQDFVNVQKHAEYVVTFATLAKGKNFKGVKADSLEELKAEVNKSLASKATEYVTKPTAATQTLTEQLKAEALNFMNFQETSSKVDKINNFLQQFNVLKDYEDFGLFFEDGITKLNNLYTLQQVVDAVTEVIDLV